MIRILYCKRSEYRAATIIEKWNVLTRGKLVYKGLLVKDVMGFLLYNSRNEPFQRRSLSRNQTYSIAYYNSTTSTSRMPPNEDLTRYPGLLLQLVDFSGPFWDLLSH